MDNSELYGEDPHEVTSLAVRLYSKDHADGDLEKYQELKAKFSLLAATSQVIPPEYLERAAAAIRANREEMAGKNKKNQAVTIIVVGLSVVVAGLTWFMLAKHGVLMTVPSH
jgi:hypothetical protein